MNAKDNSTTTPVFRVGQLEDATVNDIKADMCLAMPALSWSLTPGATSATSSSSGLGCPSSVVGVVVEQSETCRPANDASASLRLHVARCAVHATHSVSLR